MQTLSTTSTKVAMFVARWRSNAAGETAYAERALQACLRVETAATVRRFLREAQLPAEDDAAVARLAPAARSASGADQLQCLQILLAQRQQLAEQWTTNVRALLQTAPNLCMARLCLLCACWLPCSGAAVYWCMCVESPLFFIIAASGS